MLSNTVEYAMRAMLYVARQDGRSVRVNEIAEATDAPRNYLAKVLGSLARGELLVSTRGPAGGFILRADASQVRLSQVVEAVDGFEERRCLLGHGRCGDNPSCAAHARWAPLAKELDGFFATTTLADLLESSANGAASRFPVATDRMRYAMPNYANPMENET